VSAAGFYIYDCLIYYKIICVIHQDSTFINVSERQDENSPPLIRAVHLAKLYSISWNYLLSKGIRNLHIKGSINGTGDSSVALKVQRNLKIKRK
jgi:hypothetical protein